MGEREEKGKEENEDHEDDTSVVKVGQRRAATLRIRNLTTGCADAIIKPEMLFKWQLKPEKEVILGNREEETGYGDRRSLYF